jgi:hypothetical protein
MGRGYGNGKGISKSAIPYKRSAPSWLNITGDEVNSHICKLAKKVCVLLLFSISMLCVCNGMLPFCLGFDSFSNWCDSS